MAYKLYLKTDKFVVVADTDNDALVIGRSSSHKLTLADDASSLHLKHAKIMQIYGIMGSIKLLGGYYLIVIKNRALVGKINDQQIWRITETEVIPFTNDMDLNVDQQLDEKVYLDRLNQALEIPNYYYSTTYDLTHTLQRQSLFEPDVLLQPLWMRADSRFLWNKFLLSPFTSSKQKDPVDLMNKFIIPVMCGFVSIHEPSVNDNSFVYALISRRNVNRAGTRYNVRGIDERGDVANNCETEQIVVNKETVKRASFVQTRGSIPLYWEQKPNLKWKPKPVLTKPTEDAEAIQLHFQQQKELYGNQVCVNLVDQKGGEEKLGKTYGEQVEAMNDDKLMYFGFDYHHKIRSSDPKTLDNLLAIAVDPLKDIKYFSATGSKVHQMQKGVIRTNCMDNLDRTNVAQSVFGRHILPQQLATVGVCEEGDSVAAHKELDSLFKNIWADNADNISRQYSGTGALKTDMTRTGVRTKAGMMNDGLNAVTRYYLNSFADGDRHDCFSLILGYYRPSKSKPSPYDHSNNGTVAQLCSVVGFLGFLMLVSTVLSPFAGDSWSYKIGVCVLWGGLCYIGYGQGKRVLPKLVQQPKLKRTLDKKDR